MDAGPSPGPLPVVDPTEDTILVPTGDPAATGSDSGKYQGAPLREIHQRLGRELWRRLNSGSVSSRNNGSWLMIGSRQEEANDAHKLCCRTRVMTQFCEVHIIYERQRSLRPTAPSLYP